MNGDVISALFFGLIFTQLIVNSISNPHVLGLPKLISPSALLRLCNSGNIPIVRDERKESSVCFLCDDEYVFAELPTCELKDEFHETQLNNNPLVTPKYTKAKFSPAFKVIIAGAPASGKGTQCETIKNEFGLVHLSTGDILRVAVQQETSLGLLAKPFMDSGNLVPDSLVIDLILNRLKQHDCRTRGWLLDGFPRTKSQADALRESGIIPDVFLMLDVPESILIERVTGRRSDPVTGKIYHMKYNLPESEEVALRLVQRSDDTAEKVMVRYKDFQNNIDAIKDSYEDKMIRIDGSAAPSEVSLSIIEELDGVIIKKREKLSNQEGADESHIKKINSTEMEYVLPLKAEKSSEPLLREVVSS
jgi:adenylate kinase